MGSFTNYVHQAEKNISAKQLNLEEMENEEGLELDGWSTVVQLSGMTQKAVLF